jgi:hypothetical protein
MGKNSIELLEQQEIIQKLIDKGYGKLVDVLLTNESKVYTKKGRINKSGACRALNWTPKQLDEAFMECRKILGFDVFEL